MQKTEKNKQKSHVSLLFRLAIAAGASWIILKDLDFPQLAHTFQRLNPAFLVIAILAFIFGQAVVGCRWWLVLKAQRTSIPLVLAIKLTFLGHFFSQFMPSSVGGDLVRAWYVSRYSDKKLQAALGVAVDRIVGLISTFLLAFGCYFLFMRDSNIFQISRDDSIGRWSLDPEAAIPVFLSSLFVIAGLMIVLISVKTSRILMATLYRQGLHFVSQFKEVLRVYYHHPGIFAAGILLTLFLQGTIILSYWSIGRDLELQAPVTWYFVFFPMVWAFGSIPVSIAGIGILEGGLVFLFVKFAGADAETAMALALCQRLSWLVAAVPGMWFHLTGGHRTGSKTIS